MRKADVSSQAEVATALARAVEKYGRIDVLHNNVGIVKVGGPVEASEEDWSRIVAVDQTGVFLTCKHVLPIMERQRSGAIINIASIAAIQWLGVSYVAYTATKAAIIGLTKSIARQYAPLRIRATCILPGLMDTPMIREPLKNAYDGDVEQMIEKRNAQWAVWEPLGTSLRRPCFLRPTRRVTSRAWSSLSMAASPSSAHDGSQRGPTVKGAARPLSTAACHETDSAPRT